MKIYIFILLNLFCGVCLSQEITGLDLIEKYQETQENLESFIIKSYTEQENRFSSINNGRATKSHVSQELRSDGERISMRSNIWGQIGPQDLPKDKPMYKSKLWDGNNAYEYIKASSAINDKKKYHGTLNFNYYEKDNTDNLKSRFSNESSGSFSSGLFYADKKRVVDILREAKSLQLLDSKEGVNDSDCYVLIGKTKYGEYKLWIDPEHDYHLSKAIITRRPGDYESITNYTLEKGAEVVIELSDVKFKKVEGQWIPSESLQKIHRKYPDGKWSDVSYTHKANEILLNPNHEALNSFVPDDIEEGARVLIKGVRSINYTWQDGELVANIDEAAIDQLDRMAEDILAAENTVARVLLTLDEILAEYRKTQRRLASIYCEGTISGKDDSVTKDIYACQGVSFSVQILADDKMTCRFTMDTNKTVYVTKDLVEASINKKKPYQLLATVYSGSPLLGYLNSQPERVDTLLSKVSKEATVSEEKLNKKSCYLVKATIGKDTYRVWFLPEQGYHIVKAEVKTDSKIVYLLNHVRLKKIEDVWVPVSCTVKDVARQYTYERTKIDLKPDFSAIKAFESEIVDGTKVTVEGMAGEYFWNSGRVVDKDGKNAF